MNTESIDNLSKTPKEELVYQEHLYNKTLEGKEIKPCEAQDLKPYLVEKAKACVKLTRKTGTDDFSIADWESVVRFLVELGNFRGLRGYCKALNIMERLNEAKPVSNVKETTKNRIASQLSGISKGNKGSKDSNFNIYTDIKNEYIETYGSEDFDEIVNLVTVCYKDREIAEAFKKEALKENKE